MLREGAVPGGDSGGAAARDGLQGELGHQRCLGLGLVAPDGRVQLVHQLQAALLLLHRLQHGNRGQVQVAGGGHVEAAGGLLEGARGGKQRFEVAGVWPQLLDVKEDRPGVGGGGHQADLVLNLHGQMAQDALVGDGHDVEAEAAGGQAHGGLICPGGWLAHGGAVVVDAGPGLACQQPLDDQLVLLWLRQAVNEGDEVSAQLAAVVVEQGPGGHAAGVP